MQADLLFDSVYSKVIQSSLKRSPGLTFNNSLASPSVLDLPAEYVKFRENASACTARLTGMSDLFTCIGWWLRMMKLIYVCEPIVCNNYVYS